MNIHEKLLSEIMNGNKELEEILTSIGIVYGDNGYLLNYCQSPPIMVKHFKVVTYLLQNGIVPYKMVISDTAPDKINYYYNNTRDIGTLIAKYYE